MLKSALERFENDPDANYEELLKRITSAQVEIKHSQNIEEENSKVTFEKINNVLKTNSVSLLRKRIANLESENRKLSLAEQEALQGTNKQSVAQAQRKLDENSKLIHFLRLALDEGIKREQENKIKQPSNEKSVEVKEISTKTEEVKDSVEPSSNKTYNIPVANINQDHKRFQNREGKFSEESVNKIVNNFDERKLEDITVWRDPKDGKIYNLSGHSRTESMKRLGKKTIPAKFFRGTEKEAIEFARNSNNQTPETIVERSNYYRDLRESGTDEKAILKEAKLNEANNYIDVIALSHLNPNGKALDSYKKFSKGSDSNSTMLKNMAVWIGTAREEFPQLTNQHENEIFDFLFDKKNYDTIRNKSTLINKLDTVVNRLDFDSKEPLNLSNTISKTPFEMEKENHLQTLKNEKSEILSQIKARTKLLEDAGKVDAEIQNDTKIKQFKKIAALIEKEIITLKNRHGSKEQMLFSKSGGNTQSRSTKPFRTPRVEKYYDNNVEKWENAKREVDQFADDLIKGTSAEVLKTRLKSKDRFTDKVNREYRGDVSKITDVVRNTIVVDSLKEADKLISQMKASLKKQGKTFLKEKNYLQKPNERGYTGSIFVFKSSNGTPVEVQVNLKKTLLAKDTSYYNSLSKKVQEDIKYSLEKITGSKNFPIGIDHWFYEMLQALDNKDSKLRKKLNISEKEVEKLAEEFIKVAQEYYAIVSEIPDTLARYTSSEISSLRSDKAFAKMLESVTKELVWGLKTDDLNLDSVFSLIKYPTSAVSKYLNLSAIVDSFSNKYNKKSGNSQTEVSKSKETHPAERKEKLVTPRQITTDLANSLGLKLGQHVKSNFRGDNIIKRFSKRALGIFFPNSGIIRITSANDIRTFAHELGHKLDFENFNITDKYSFDKFNKLEKIVTLANGRKEPSRTKILDKYRDEYGDNEVELILAKIKIRHELQAYAQKTGRFTNWG